MSDCDALFQLNRDLFAAEEKTRIGDEAWGQWLGHVLGDDFTIRRANPAVPRQNREAMIGWICERTVSHREPFPAETLWCSKSLGVIVGPLLMQTARGVSGNIRASRSSEGTRHADGNVSTGR
jgi:hypothetical protein